MELAHKMWMWITTALHVAGCVQRPCHQEHLSIRRENPSSVLASATGRNVM